MCAISDERGRAESGPGPIERRRKYRIAEIVEGRIGNEERASEKISRGQPRAEQMHKLGRHAVGEEDAHHQILRERKGRPGYEYGRQHKDRFYLSESLTKSVQQSCCCCEGHAASRSTICWMALSAR